MTLQPNPDLTVGADHKPRWNSADGRRHGFHNLHRIARYVQSFRAADVLSLHRDTDVALAARPDVAQLTGLPFFSAMVVLRGDRVLFERYAPDFGPDQPHSIMSLSKTTMMLIIGRLVAEGRIDLAAPVDRYLPWVGPGYATASVQDVLNMNVDNDYVEDYADPLCTAFLHEAATGLRLPGPGQAERTSKQFLATVGLAPGRSDTVNAAGLCMYRSANTDILAAIAEAVGGPLAARLADIADAAGLEGSLHVATDRSGFPCLNGGLCLTARAASQRWRVIRCEWAPAVQAVVAIPAIRLSTAEARRAMPRSIPIPDAVLNLGALTLLLQGLRTGNGDLIADGMHDRIHEPYRWGLIQGGRAVRQAALEAGAWGCVISGAGPTLLALGPPERAPAISEAMVQAWSVEGVSSRGEVLSLQEAGSRWEPLPER